MSDNILLLTDQIDSFIVELLKDHLKKKHKTVRVLQLNQVSTDSIKNDTIDHILVLAYNKDNLEAGLHLPLPAPVSIVFVGAAPKENDIRSWASKGMKGIIHNAATIQELEDCIALQSENKLVLSQHLKSMLLDSVLSGKKEVDIKDLTNIEIKILQASKEGCSIKEIADKLQLSPYTIAAYRARMLKKTGVRSINKLIHILFS